MRASAPQVKAACAACLQRSQRYAGTNTQIGCPEAAREGVGLTAYDADFYGAAQPITRTVRTQLVRAGANKENSPWRPCTHVRSLLKTP